MANKITQKQLHQIILERGFETISKTIKRQILEGVQTHNLTFLEIGQLVWYLYERKNVEVRPMYGLGPIYNIKDEALKYFKSLDTKTKQQEEAMEKHLEQVDDPKRVTVIKPQERKFKAPKIDLENL